ncbi:hypothetical protein AACH06_09895 [Ideonella sp. DXS29W]|uniref:Uncharacterized protein n=1 Tax=Ideonella lacteola TaxID=2984193 RepID=A0ABU9BQE8_9BURK
MSDEGHSPRHMPHNNPQHWPHYWPRDTVHLMDRLGPFYLGLSNKSITRQLQSLCASVQGYEKYLGEYPMVMCAPLDSLYVFRRATGMLDEDLLQDLLFAFSWREANWGAWLAALAPQAAYAPHLRRRRAHLPHGTSVIDLALAGCAGEPVPAEVQDALGLLGRLRQWLQQMPPIHTPLRRAPSADEWAARASEIEQIRQAYRQGGADRALQRWRSGPLAHELVDLGTWVRSGGKPPVG